MGMTEHNLQADTIRGEEARRVLQSEVYKEAYAAVRERLVAQLESADIPAERRQRIVDLLVAHKVVNRYMEQMMVTGTMAEMEIDRQQSLSQKMRGIFRAA